MELSIEARSHLIERVSLIHQFEKTSRCEDSDGFYSTSKGYGYESMVLNYPAQRLCSSCTDPALPSRLR